MTDFPVGDKVAKTGGDYSFEGTVVAAFAKLGGEVRYVVEDGRGLLFIFSRRNLQRSDVDSSTLGG